MTTPATGRPPTGRSSRGHGRLSAARLVAVQAVFRIDFEEITSPEQVIAEFEHRRGDENDEGQPPLDPDPELFAELVRGVWARREEIDTLISGALSGRWSIERVERLLVAVMRVGTFEMIARTGVPAKVVINEYVEVARAFFGRGEPAMVNAVLDRIAHDRRPDEFSPPSPE